MELLVASGIGLLTAVGLYMMLRLESFPSFSDSRSCPMR